MLIVILLVILIMFVIVSVIVIVILIVVVIVIVIVEAVNQCARERITTTILVGEYSLPLNVNGKHIRSSSCSGNKCPACSTVHPAPFLISLPVRSFREQVLYGTRQRIPLTQVEQAGGVHLVFPRKQYPYSWLR
jgi:hypothetical protein